MTPTAGYTLAIEISNPSSGPRGPQQDGTLAGPGVALGRIDEQGDSELLGVELLGGGSRHDDDLMPAIDRLFKRCGARPAELSRIAVSIGPGGYTSLRIAVATAKMLAEATGAKTIAVQSASVAAWRVPINSAPAIVCLASKGPAAYGVLLPAGLTQSDWWPRTGLAAAQRLVGSAAANELDLRLKAGFSWIAASAPLGMLAADAIDLLRPATVVADEFLPVPMRDAAERVGASIVEPVFAPASALTIAAGIPPMDPLALVPLYGREAEAVTQWRLRKR